jgi:hypothetical protein
VADEVRATILALRQPGRAITAGDFEHLARKVPGVARAHCLPRRNLELGDRAGRALDGPADVSVVIVPEGADAASVVGAVRAALEKARLLTTRLHVVAPRPVPIAPVLTVRGRGGTVATRAPASAPRPGVMVVTLTIHGRGDAVEERLLDQAETALRTFLDPRAGGPEGRGWPLGRFVHLSEIYDLLARLPGTDHVTSTEGKPEVAADPVEAWRLRDHAAGELAAIALDPDELPSLQSPAGKLSVKSPGRA